MKKIMLVCALGMSTSLLVKRMEEAAEKEGIKVEIFAKAEEAAKRILNQGEVNAVLLGPQVSYSLNDFEKIASKHNIPVQVISTGDYGMMDGSKVLHNALEIIG